MSGDETVLCPDWSTRFANSPKGTAMRPAETLNQVFGMYSICMCSSSRPWQLMQALVEKATSSETSTPIFTAASIVTLPGERFCTSGSWIHQ